MSEQPDPERLLAEALRAQAVQAPLPDPARLGLTGGVNQPTDPGEPLLKLLSGTEHQHGLLGGRASDTVSGLRPVQPPHLPHSATGVLPTAAIRPARQPLGVGWIILLAVLLGLAAGAAAGLISIV